MEDNSGTISGGETASIPLSISTSGIEAGTYEAFICIQSNIGQKINIPVTLEVTYSTEEHEENAKKLSSHPNPFAYSTTISFYIPEFNHENTQIMIYNIKGQLVREIEAFNCIKGLNEIEWNGRDYMGNNVSSGIYFYRVKADDEIIGTNKCLLIGD